MNTFFLATFLLVKIFAIKSLSFLLVGFAQKRTKIKIYICYIMVSIQNVIKKQ